MFDDQELTGRTRTHIVQIDQPRFAAHPKAAEAFLRMRDAAAEEGFEISPFSSFRDYAAQLRIWNNKFDGSKPLYDLEGQVRDRSELGEDGIIRCILNWSALPGASRHHWGTEIDVVDAAAMPEGYKIKLLPEETAEGGLFAPLHRWLDDNLYRFEFFRPYARYIGGMYPEPWHLSYSPLSVPALADMSIDLLAKITRDSDMLGKKMVLEMLPEIFEKHVLNIVPPPGQ